ncbi:unnamed protein product [Lactuca saligna]|uniref:Uncharacterized protein n=1 Tax=Lactuca saligna TaxID=75948 RepID=A0AA35VEC8_LACSI|nr:unnamed protein product [Lactuca saligna]
MQHFLFNRLLGQNFTGFHCIEIPISPNLFFSIHCHQLFPCLFLCNQFDFASPLFHIFSDGAFLPPSVCFHIWRKLLFLLVNNGCNQILEAIFTAISVFDCLVLVRFLYISSLINCYLLEIHYRRTLTRFRWIPRPKGCRGFDSLRSSNFNYQFFFGYQMTYIMFSCNL